MLSGFFQRALWQEDILLNGLDGSLFNLREHGALRCQPHPLTATADSSRAEESPETKYLNIYAVELQRWSTN